MTKRLGLAWEAGALVAVETGAGGEGDAPLRRAAVPGHGDGPPAPEAIAEALAAAGIEARRAVLAIGGDSIAVKPIALPPVGEPTRQAILREDGDRYFLLPPSPRCYAVWGGAGEEEAWAVAASETEIVALLQVMAEAGIEVEAVTAAPAVYREAALRRPGDVIAPAAVVRAYDGLRERIAYRDGEPVDYRRLEAGGREDGGKDDGTVVFEEGSGGRTLAALGAALVDPGWGGLPDLVPVSVRTRHRRERSRRTVRIAAAAALLLVTFVGLFAARRERHQEQLAERLEAVRAEAAPVVAMREELERISHQLAAHRRIVDSRVDWLERLRELSVALPRDAWLASLETREGGGVVLVGYAGSASEVLAALTATPGVADVRFDRQAARTAVGGRAVESFGLEVEWSDAAE